jgi:HK97 family phage major capsid protein
VVTNGKTQPNAVVVSPEDGANMDISKSGAASATYGYWAGGPFTPGQPTMWGMRIVESQALTPGTAIVGDFTRCVVYDREAATLSIGTANDDFIRNLLRILAELRVGFAVLRPQALCIVTLA